MEQIYNKLVRDKIPDIIRKNGEKPTTRQLTTEEFRGLLIKKINEEYVELVNASKQDDILEECADILEIIFSIGKIEGASQAEMLEVMNRKREKRGGFENKMFLEKVEIGE